MKYIKIYEKWNSDLAIELVDELDYDTVESYYDEHGAYDDVEEIVSLWPSIIWNHIDDDKYVEDIIRDEINSQSISDFEDEDDYRSFIEDNWDSKKQEDVLELWKSKQYDDKEMKNRIAKIDGVVSIIENKIIITSTDGAIKKYKIPESHNIIVYDGDFVNKGTVLSIVPYEDSMLEDLDTDELKEVIEDSNEEDEYVEKMVRNRYEGEDAQGIIKQIYGDTSKMDGKELYDMLSWYLDDDKIIKEYNDNTEFDSKKEFVQDEIYNSIELQREILKNNKKTVLKLAELFIDNSSNSNIADEYEFQKLYIKQYLKEKKGEDKKGALIATALKNLNDEFGLDDSIKTEYSKWTWLIDADKYNM